MLTPVGLCTGTLSDALSTSGPRLAAGCAMGLLAVAGWGLAAEWFLRRRLREVSWAHAFVEGTVIVSALRLAASLVGVANLSWPIAIVGCALLPLAAIRGGLVRPDRRELQWGALVAALALPACIVLAGKPAIFSDLTAIWGLHAKALTCEPLLTSHYVTEPVWAGTHPDYPLYLPFLHSFFFTLQGSFRDDWVKVWQAAAWMATLIAIRRTLTPRVGSMGALATVIALASVNGVPAYRAGLIEGLVELNTLAFLALACATIFSDEPARLPLYLFGLATTKHEGLIIAAAFLALYVAARLAAPGNRRARLAQALPWAAPCAVLLLAWLVVLRLLPSRHENYPAELMSAAAWSRGFANGGEILRGWLSTATHWPWVIAFVMAPVAAVVAVRALRRGLETQIATASLICVATLAVAMAAFLATYFVSPWGPGLYQNTLDRLFAEVFPLAIFATVGALWTVREAMRDRAPTIALGLFVLAFALPSIPGHAQCIGVLSKQIRHGAWGRGAYQSEPHWKAALQVDTQVPPLATGATVDMTYYFTWAYMLYPRLVYPQRKDVVAGTWRPWTPWKTPEEVPWKELGLTYWVSDNGFGLFSSSALGPP